MNLYQIEYYEEAKPNAPLCFGRVYADDQLSAINKILEYSLHTETAVYKIVSVSIDKGMF